MSMIGILAVSMALAAGPEMTVRDQYLAGSELRVLVSTAELRKRQFRSGHESVNERGWLVLIDLAKSGSLTQTGRVIGPLWSVNGPQSILTFHHGVTFDKADEAAKRTSRPSGFDDLGQLIRQSPTAALGDKKETDLIVERFDLAASPTAWVKHSDAKRIGQVGPDFIEGRLRSRAARMLVQEEADGKVRAYDLFSGVPRDDAWLTAAFADLRSRGDLRNTMTWLTDDLNFIVSRPADTVQLGGNQVETFTIDGSAYSRNRYGVVYTRPSLKPVPFKKWEGDDFVLGNPPHGVFSVGGELLLLEIGYGALTLSGIDGKARYQWERAGATTWNPRTVRDDARMEPAAGRLILFDTLKAPDDKTLGDEHFTFAIWNFKAGTLQRESLDLSELFEVKDDNYVPRQPVALP